MSDASKFVRDTFRESFNAAAGTDRLIERFNIPDTAFNAMEHTKASAWLEHNLGRDAATKFGDWKEEYLPGDSWQDEFKDQWNNEVGRRISEYVEEYDLPTDAIDALIDDAFRNDELIIDELNDSRIPDSQNNAFDNEQSYKNATYDYGKKYFSIY